MHPPGILEESYIYQPVAEAHPPFGGIDWEVEYARHAAAILGYLVKLVGDPDTARDLTQDTFERGMRRALQLKDQGALRPWLFRIATNLALGHLRWRQRRKFLRLDGLTQASQPGENEARFLVRAALASLKPEYAIALVLRYRGFTRKEIAQITDSPEETVKSRLARGAVAFERAYRSGEAP